MRVVEKEVTMDKTLVACSASKTDECLAAWTATNEVDEKVEKLVV